MPILVYLIDTAIYVTYFYDFDNKSAKQLLSESSAVILAGNLIMSPRALHGKVHVHTGCGPHGCSAH